MKIFKCVSLTFAFKRSDISEWLLLYGFCCSGCLCFTHWSPGEPSGNNCWLWRNLVRLHQDLKNKNQIRKFSLIVFLTPVSLSYRLQILLYLLSISAHWSISSMRAGDSCWLCLSLYPQHPEECLAFHISWMN